MMNQDLYIGIDLGTSAMKLLLMDAEGTIVKIVTEEYPLEFPKEGWSQQNPEDWKTAVMDGIPELLKGFDASCVAGIGCGGQMHGLVVLDEDDNVIRPAVRERPQKELSSNPPDAAGSSRAWGIPEDIP